MTDTPQARPRRLDEIVAPGWVGLVVNLLRGGGLLAALLLAALGFLTGGFFLLLTGMLAAVALIGGWVLASFVSREAWYRRPNARWQSFLLSFAFPIVLVLLAQLVGPALTPPATTSHCFSGSLERGEQRDEALPVDPRISQMELRLSVPVLENGALRWWLTDPVGQIQWGGRAEAEGYSEGTSVEPQGGRWTVSVLSDADRAQYRIEWYGATGGEAPVSEPPACP